MFFYYLCPIYFRSKNVLFILKKCTFRFADYISFKKEGDNRLVNIDFEDGVKYIKIDASSLTMLYTTDGKTWTANAKR